MNPIIFFLFFSLIILSFFLSFISSLYSSVDLSKIDLITIKRDGSSRQNKKIVFILQHNYLLFIVICFFQTFLNIFLSTMGMEEAESIGLVTPGTPSYFFSVVLLSLFLVFISEIFVRFLIERNNKKLILNKLFLNCGYFITKLIHPLSFLIKPKKKIFSNNEDDLIRLINNLTMENVLEKREAELVTAAFNFDEETIRRVLIPYKKIVFIYEEMNLKEVQQIYSKHHFSRYPVIKEKKLLGILNFKALNLFVIKNEKNNNWKEAIDREIISLSIDSKLNAACDILKNDRHHLAVIKEKGKIVGLITLEDILEILIGSKIKHW